MKNDELLQLQIALTLIKDVGPIIGRSLVSYCGGVEAVFKEKSSRLEKIPGIGKITAEKIAGHDKTIFSRAEKEVAFVRKNKVQAFFYLDEIYPQRLKRFDDAPLMLYHKGNVNYDCKKILAIVGTRKTSEYGRIVTEKFVEDFAPHDMLILSGLAFGVDIAAHRSALKFNIPTTGVLAHGLDTIYPGEHRSTAERMIENGSVLTEYMSGTIPDRNNFPSRNRIVAGLADAVLVIESALKGGALITAEIANSYNKDVFCVPGNIDAAMSQGCNYFIRTNRAMLCDSPTSLLDAMNWNSENVPVKKKAQLDLFHQLNDDEKVLVTLLNAQGQLSIDSISMQVSLPVSKVSSTLLNLEFAGYVKSLPGKMYQLN